MPGPRTIALVEDHALIAIGFKDLIATAPDLELAAMVESVADLSALRGKLDLVVLDLRLMDGSRPESNVDAIHDLGAQRIVG